MRAFADAAGMTSVEPNEAFVTGKVHEDHEREDRGAPLGHGDQPAKPAASLATQHLISLGRRTTTVARVTGPSIRELAERHGVRPTKSLGQNFLLDPNLARAIAADAEIGPGTRVVEVGAGMGSLTCALADAGPDGVLAIEFDRGLLPILADAVRDRPTVRILHADATKLDWSSTLGDGPWVLVANLPYNVGTSIVLDVLEDVPVVHRLVVMLQREVGERLVARPRDEAYGAVSLRVGARAAARLVRRVPPDVFWPRPTVGSVIVRLDRLDPPPRWADDARVWRVVDGAFGQRRKTMRNALRRLGLEPDAADELLAEAGVPPSARPEELAADDFVRVAEGLPA